MALGGGIFVAQNKKLPGSYINFVSLAMATSNVSDRGVAAFGLALDWGVDGEVFTVTKADFEKNSLKLFGYEYGHNKVKGLREQIAALTKAEDSKFMFNAVTAPKMKGAKTGEDGIEDGDKGVDTSKMTYDELCAYLAETPEATLS